ncbi:response regulator [Salinibius halmophilus]|uniref:response regulator n=1 Tax=Salinibius halmophilus TaxID=1853216 RepID=UPI000E668D7B|nr:response regulator [Salinibius halmophilus]
MKRVLVVDDAVTVRLYHCDLLKTAGFDVCEAENGVEALEHAMQQPFDLMLVDVNMPKMDGYRLMCEVRRQEALRGIPIVMISTEQEEQDRQQAYAKGANYYLVKPAEPELLVNIALVMTGGSQ